jgi:hypothetical protein
MLCLLYGGGGCRMETILFTGPVGMNLLEHGADVNMQNNVSTATCGLAVMVEMVGCGDEG